MRHCQRFTFITALLLKHPKSLSTPASLGIAVSGHNPQLNTKFQEMLWQQSKATDLRYKVESFTTETKPTKYRLIIFYSNPAITCWCRSRSHRKSLKVTIRHPTQQLTWKPAKRKALSSLGPGGSPSAALSNTNLTCQRTVQLLPPSRRDQVPRHNKQKPGSLPLRLSNFITLLCPWASSFFSV